MELYAITDGVPPGSLVRRWAGGGVAFIQLRAKHLLRSELATEAALLRAQIVSLPSKLLINLPSPEWAGVALDAGADGIHLAGKLQPGAVQTIRKAVAGHPVLVSLPCHNLEDIALARSEGADLLLFSPIFEKGSAIPQGLPGLEQACVHAAGLPVFALGGISLENAPKCIGAGAAGVAGIRLFAGDEWLRLSARHHPTKHI